MPTLSYTATEIRGFLPSGWNLRAGAAGRWNPKRGEFVIEVKDPADVEWPLVVDRRDLEESDGDRLVALRSAVDELYRESLG
jgi:hypothetical protein